VTSLSIFRIRRLSYRPRMQIFRIVREHVRFDGRLLGIELSVAWVSLVAVAAVDADYGRVQSATRRATHRAEWRVVRAHARCAVTASPDNDDDDDDCDDDDSENENDHQTKTDAVTRRRRSCAV